MRGRSLEEWIVLNGMIVLNEPSELYTFSGKRGQSDINDTLNDVKAGCRFEWEVKCDWGISDHNVILIRMISECRYERLRSGWKRWMSKNVDWESYKSELIETVRLNGIELMNETDVGRMAECVTGYIQEVNGEYMKECER